MDVVPLATDSVLPPMRGFAVVWNSPDGESRVPLQAAEDIDFENARPVRSFSSYRSQRHFPGWYWSATTGCHVPYESWLERDHATLLDFDPLVTAFAAQPLWLSWQDRDTTRRHSHALQFFARGLDGTGMVIDCRPAERIDEHAELVFAATRTACDIGWDYRVAGAADPVRVRNLRWLAGYRHPRHGADVSLTNRVRSAFAAPAPLVAHAAVVGEPMMVLPVVFHLLWLGRLHADLSLPLDDRPYHRLWTVVMTANTPLGVLRLGDQVRFGGQTHTVVGLAGAAVRLAGELAAERDSRTLMSFIRGGFPENFMCTARNLGAAPRGENGRPGLSVEWEFAYVSTVVADGRKIRRIFICDRY